jgi:hypothetical protein
MGNAPDSYFREGRIDYVRNLAIKIIDLWPPGSSRAAGGHNLLRNVNSIEGIYSDLTRTRMNVCTRLENSSTYPLITVAFGRLILPLRAQKIISVAKAVQRIF